MIYKRKWPAAVFLLPAFVFMVIFLFYPFIRNIIDSFFNVSQLGAPHGAFIGAENYLKIIPGLETTDPNMVIAVKNTLLLMACTIVFQVGIALVLALMVDTIQKGSQVFRTLFFFPIVVSATALGLLFNLMLMTRGPINQLIESLGGTRIIFKEQYTFLTMAIPVVWQYVGFYFVILVTGLNNISEDVKEAAEIDGATGFKRIRYITLPLLRNVLVTCLTLSITGALKVFDLPWVMFPPNFADAYLTGTYMYYQTFQTSNVDYAAAIGALGGDPVYLLEVMNHVPRETVEAAAALVKAGKVRVNVAQVPQKLYIEVIAKGGGHTGRAIVRDLHTNVVLVEQDGVATLDKRDTDTAAAGDSDVVSPEQIASFLTVRSIWDYCTKELDPMNDPIDIIRSAVKVNSVISDEGLSKEYGLAIGRNLDLNCRKGLMTRDLTTNSMIAAAAGADARMAGAPVSVVANSGSGNQGITATMPVVATARWLDIDEEKMLRAVTLSNLIAIRIKAKFGRLSNLCGATVAATGAACGIAYLLGGGYHEVCCTIQNMVGNVTGMVCDGAKADCALKISTCVNAACQAAAMGVRGVRVQSTDGIVEHNVEYTLDNFATLSTHGTSDSVILDLMLNKHLPETE